MRDKFLAVIIIVAIATLQSCKSCTTDETNQKGITAISIASNDDVVTINHKAITVYYDTKRHIPLCVVHLLTRERMDIINSPMAVKRKGMKYYADPDCKESPDWNELKGSGYDRGHMAPAGDMRWDAKAMQECFYMTNICAQDRGNNAGIWNRVENQVRDWAARTDTLIIFTGTITEKNPTFVGKKDNIAVPTALFKVVYDTSRQKAIAFLIPNSDIDGKIQNYTMSVRQLEARCGVDFFCKLPKRKQDEIENNFNQSDWMFK